MISIALRGHVSTHLLGLCVTCACGFAASGQPNISHSFGPDQCGPVDPAYIRTANETGGVPLFLQRNEAIKAMQLMRESTRENVSTVLWASAKLDGGMQKFEIPVDSTTERITFTFSVDTKSSRLVLKQPDGNAIREGSPRTEDTELNCGRIITVAKPEAGSWRAEVSGSGTYWLEAQAQSEIYFISAEFVKLGGRPGHEGLFKIQGQPLAGEPATLQATVSAAETRMATLSLVSESGDVLQKLRMTVAGEERDPLEFTGEVPLPGVPFRVAVSGQDTKGMRFQRFFGPLFHAATVALIPKMAFEELAPGSTREAEFEIRNLGPARSFEVVVTDARRFATFGERRSINLGAHQTGSFKVKLTVPSGTEQGVEDDLVVVASSTSGAQTTNSAIVRLTVSAR
jgi:von Willebrand factor A domain-containing protein 7